MPRTENEDWLLYQTFDDGTQDSGFKAFRAGLDIMEKRFTCAQHTQPAIVAQAADDWFAANNSVTVRQAFMAGVSWAQQQQASA